MINEPAIARNHSINYKYQSQSAYGTKGHLTPSPSARPPAAAARHCPLPFIRVIWVRSEARRRYAMASERSSTARPSARTSIFVKSCMTSAWGAQVGAPCTLGVSVGRNRLLSRKAWPGAGLCNKSNQILFKRLAIVVSMSNKIPCR